MSISADDLLVWAELEQHKETEAGVRASVSRAYYAAYHSALEFHNALDYPGEVPERPGGMHKRLCYQLQHPSKDIDDGNVKRISRFKGKKLSILHQLRTRADYALDDTLGERHVIEACGVAARIMGKHLMDQPVDASQVQQPSQT